MIVVIITIVFMGAFGIGLCIVANDDKEGGPHETVY